MHGISTRWAEEAMTVKRDLKRRVRQRQARTGESYVTARRHVVAAKAASNDADADPETDSKAIDPPGVTASHPAADPADAAAASAETGAPRDAAGTAPVADPAASSDAAAAGAVAAAIDTDDTGPVRAAAGAVAAAIDTDDTGPVRAAAMPPAAVVRASGAAPTPGAPDPGNPARAAVSVVELLDVSDQARRFGLVCRVAMFPTLAARVEPASVLARLRDLLVETAGDPQFQLLSQAALTGHVPPRSPQPSLQSFQAVQRFFRRAVAGIGGVSEDGTTLVFHIAGRDGLVPVGCALHWPRASLVLSGIDELVAEATGLRDWFTAEGRTAAVQQATDLVYAHLARKPFAPTLFVVHAGRRHAITQDEFLIGRSRATVHLAIKDGMVSRHHAAVIRRQGVHYLKDLGSTHGITYKGMRIDYKRIEEGDVFQLGDHELMFTFQDEK
jgi:hypothetical protein